MEDYSSAYTSLDEGLAISRELDHKFHMANAFETFGDLYRKKGNYKDSHTNYVQSLVLLQKLGSQSYVAHGFECIAHLFTKHSEWRRAACLLGAAESLWQDIGSSRLPTSEPEFKNTCDELINYLSEEGFDLSF